MTERPLECCECKKPITVKYTEIIGNNIVHTHMCEDCPILQQKLHGSSSPNFANVKTEMSAGLCCGTCETTLEDIRTGNALGCEECYDVFAEVLILEMQSAHKISGRLFSDKTTSSKLIHIGRSPKETAEVNPSLRLIALNEALNEVLRKEDYEQAAWLRDQISELKAKTGQKEEASQNKEASHEEEK
jgi:protein arginine kinase activator